MKKSWPIIARPGLSLRAHPISFYREQLERLGVTPARRLVELENDAPVIVAGIGVAAAAAGDGEGDHVRDARR